MTEFFSIFQPDFLLSHALWASIVVGLFCPLIGVYFMLRRMVLLGVALPQLSAAGIAFAFFVQGLSLSWMHTEGESHEKMLALAGAFLFTVASLMLLAFLERRGQRTSESRLGALYALASAAALLFVVANPTGEMEILNLLHGEIVSVSTQDLRLLQVSSVLLVILLSIFHRQFLLVSFDPESALVAGKNLLAWDMVLYAIIGMALSVSVLVVGPLLTFAFLIIPPLAARRFVRSMLPFFVLSSLFGGLAGLTGFYLSYQMDWPLGPSDVLVAFTLLVLSVPIKALGSKLIHK